MPKPGSTASPTERARTRRHIKPRLSLSPIVRMRWHWRHHPKSGYAGVSGYRYFLFGKLPIFSRLDAR